MSTAIRAFVGRLSELSVYDPLGDKVGRVRDVVVVFSATRSRPRVIGLVVEVAGRKRIFVPMTRVTSVEGGQVITTGLVNMRRFEQRANETLVVAELFDRPVQVAVDGEQVSGTIEDVGIEQSYARDWQVSRAFIRKTSPRSALAPFGRRRGETFIVPIEEISGLATPAAEQSAARLIEAYEDLKPADLAEVIHELSPKRRAEVAAALDDERLADVIEELPEDDQVEILASLETDRAADILEAMEPDDAADLLSELPSEQAEALLQLMEPDEAADLRRLLAYDEVRKEELSAALATTVFVCRAPLETPTGKYLGMVHIQRLLREPPHNPIGAILDKDVEPLSPEDSLTAVARQLATYDLVALPVVDENSLLLGAVTVDDVLDHILPEDWREDRHDDLTSEAVGHG